MSEENNIFNEALKEKMGDFEVPYNPSHWDEMSAKLDAAGPAPSSGNSAAGLGKYALITGAAATLIAGYFLLQDNEEPTAVNETTDQVIQVEDPNVETKSEDVVIEQVDDVQTESPVSSEESIEESPAEEKKYIAEKPEEKEERYASYSEDRMKEESKEIVEQLVEENTSEIANTPQLNNSALRTDIMLNDELNCAGSEVSFSISEPIDGASYYWNFGDKGLTSRKANPKHIFKRPGNYTVTLIVSKGEKNDYKTERSLRVEAAPEVDIEMSEEEITLMDPYIEFTAHSTDDCTFRWKFNDSEKAKGQTADFLVKDKGAYPVELTAESNNGCKIVVTESYVSEKGVKMIVEDAFTPDGDGLNDKFIPKELQHAGVSFVMIVRDKTGRQIFETNDAGNPWNGKMNNTGNLMPAGPYFWIVKFADGKGRQHTQEGKVIIR